MNLQWFASAEWALIVKALTHTLWQGTVLAVVLGVLLRRCHTPLTRYRCALAALAGVLAAGVLTWAWLNRPEPRPIAAQSAPAIPMVSAPAAEPAGPVLVVNAEPSKPVNGRPGWTAWGALLWLAGATLMIGRAGFQVAGAERLRRSSHPLEDSRIAELLKEARNAIGLARNVRMAVTDKLTSPAVVGVLVPTLILPLSLVSTLSHEQIRFILLHELAHIRRGDYFANLFQLFVEALLFFNPAVWWISRQVRVEREACCDALAIELSGAPADYARTLVHVAENVLQPSPAAAPAFGDQREPSSLADRVQRLLVPGYRPRLRLTWRAMFAALFVSGALLTLSAIGTRVTMAAILSPEQRMERIEKKMTELGASPRPDSISDTNLPKVKITGRVRTADGSPLPPVKWVNIYYQRPHAGGASSAKAQADGSFTTEVVADGVVTAGLEAPGFALALAQLVRLNGTTNVPQLDLVLDRGFDVPVEVTDAETGKPIPGAALKTQFWVPGMGMGIGGSQGFQTDVAGRAVMTNCSSSVELAIAVNAAGYQITDHRVAKLTAGEPVRIQLARGQSLSGMVQDKQTGAPLAGAAVRMIYEKGVEQRHYEWTDAARLLATTGADGRFTVNQLRGGTKYWLGISARGHESAIIGPLVASGPRELVVQLGPELVVRGQVHGAITNLQRINNDYCLYRNFSEVFENNGYGDGAWVPLKLTNGVGWFVFTNRVAGSVTLAGWGCNETRDISQPVDNWVVQLKAGGSDKAKDLPKREVVFRFKSPSGVMPRGAVSVSVPDDLNPKHRTAHSQEMEITNGEVRVPIAIGGNTSIEPKRMVGFTFNRSKWSSATGESGNWLGIIPVTSNAAPLVIEIPLIPAGAIYAHAKNADGTPAGGLFFGVSELKKAPGRDQNSLDGGNDSFSDNSPRQWISGPLPLGGTYQIHAWRGNSFCLSQPIKLTEANPDADVELQFPRGQKFVGELVDQTGKPVRDVELKVSFSLANNHGFGLKPVFTDGQGRFELADLTPGIGDYSVEIAQPGMMAALVKLDFARQPQVIRLNPGRVLGGQVVDAATGWPIPGMEVRALDYESSKLPMQTTHTDDDGRFLFNTLGDGNYTFYPDGGELLNSPANGNLRFHADDRTNLVLRVKLYDWSNLKPKAPAEHPKSRTNADGMISTNYHYAANGEMPTVGTVTGILTDPNFRPVVHALEQRSGTEFLTEPEVPATSGRGENRIFLPSISVPVSQTNSEQLLRDGKLLYEVGKLDEAQKKLKEALALDPENAAAKSYLDLVQTSLVQTNGSAAKLTYTGPGRQSIVRKLDTIRLERVEFKAATLGEVLRTLAQESIKIDPDQQGINFLINSSPEQIAVGTIDPMTGLPVATNAVVNVDLTALPVTLTPALTNATLFNVLDAVVRGASEPIHYSVQDFAVVFSSGKPDEPLFARTFKVDANSFYAALQRENNVHSNSIPNMARNYFSRLGVDLESPKGKSVFYSDTRGALYVKATLADLDTIERAISAMMPPPQIHLKARFVEVPKTGKDLYLGQVAADGLAPAAKPMPGVFPGSPSSSSTTVEQPKMMSLTGILATENFKATWQALQSRKDAKILAEPEVTTTSGRQTQMRATTKLDVITGVAVEQQAEMPDVTPTNNVAFKTEPVETGPILDSTATVLADGYTINLRVKASVTEFFGYAPARNSANAQPANTNVIKLLEIRPSLRTKEALFTAHIYDGQTLLLGNFTERTSGEENIPKQQDKELLVFVTVNLVDPAGNRVHKDGEMPAAQRGVPPQPAWAK
jgi:beta-lactamase regulating signal transducer with metallopeptidase domain/5-hydroxyisourate hydrolase-like protein (transthyretin family)